MPKKPTPGAYKVETVFIDTRPTVYNTRFKPNALQQVMQKINNFGLPLLLAHNSRDLPSGQWYEARIESNGSDEELISKFYIPNGIKEYEDVRTRIDTGILDSVSIGFSAKTRECSICHNDIHDYENCPHIPGQKYEVKDPVSGASLGETTCYVLLDDVSASEGSLVYSGAVPAAKVISASDKAEFFEKNHLNFAVGDIEIVHNAVLKQDSYEQNKDEGSNMDEKYIELQEKYVALREKNLEAQDKILAFREEAAEYKDKAEKYDAAMAQVEELKKTIDSVKAEFAEQIKTFAEKVESLAAPFDPEYKAPDDPKALLADFDKYMEKAKSLPTGRQSKNEDDASTEFQMPATAFQVK